MSAAAQRAPASASHLPARSAQAGADRPREAAASVTLTGWALLTMDGVTLALPQRDIATIELVSALQPPGADGGPEIGRFAHDAERWPVYCLDRRLAPAPALVTAARVCMLFRSDGRTLGLAGKQVSLLAADADLAVQPLPACLARPGSPLTGLALHRDRIVAVMHAPALTEYLSPLGATHGG